MKKLKDIVAIVNGKKLPIALILTIVGFSTGYGELKNKVANNINTIKDLKPIVAQVARIDERVKHTEQDVKEMKSDLKDFRDEMRLSNEKLYNAILSR